MVAEVPLPFLPGILCEGVLEFLLAWDVEVVVHTVVVGVRSCAGVEVVVDMLCAFMGPAETIDVWSWEGGGVGTTKDVLVLDVVGVCCMRVACVGCEGTGTGSSRAG